MVGILNNTTFSVSLSADIIICKGIHVDSPVFLFMELQLRKAYPTAEFPPKRLRNTTSKVLETRRAGLESWLHSTLLFEPTPPALLAFLQVHNYQPPHQE